MTITKKMLESVPFQYAADVRAGKIVTGKRIKQAVERFYRWIDEADEKGFYLDHEAGMQIINFFPTCLNHTKGKMARKPFHLAPFQQFTMYNIMAWKVAETGLRRITTIYDKRAKKNGKSAEMAGLGLYMMSFEMEMEAEIYVGATKEDQARICWSQAQSFVTSPVANPIMQRIGFFAQQKVVGFSKTKSKMMPLGGDSKTQDGINAHLSIIDEYHAHKDDSVKENLESSSVQRSQPIVYHITTAGTNIQSACKRYEDRVIEVLEGRAELDHLWVMIHDLDEGDDWEDENNWVKANPLIGCGLEIDRIRKEYENAKLQPSKIPNFKTKHLNMWVDAPTVWIPSEIWAKNKHDLTREQVVEKFRKFGGYLGVDMSINTDLTAVMAVSNPDDDGNMYVISNLFCPKDSIDRRSKEDKVPYRYWADAGYIIATDGNQVDFEIVENTIFELIEELNITRVEADKYQFEQMAQNIIREFGQDKVSYVPQYIHVLSGPTKAFERFVYNGQILHDGNPVVAWNLGGCIIIVDPNENIKVHKGKSNVNGRRIDGIPGIINAIAGILSIDDDSNQSVYNDPNRKIFI